MLILLTLCLTLACVRSATQLSEATHVPDLPATTEAILAPTTYPTFTPLPSATPTVAPQRRLDKAYQALFFGDWENGLRLFTSLDRESLDAEESFAARMGVGKAYLQAREYAQAIAIFNKIIEAYPDFHETPVAYFLIGQAYSAMERPSEAAQAYLEYLTHRPGIVDAYVLNLRADALFEAGDYSSAANDYRAALNTPSLLDRVTLQMKMARAYALAGDYTTALTLYDDIYLNTTNGYTRALIDLRRGQIYTSLGQMENAYAAYLKAVNNYPESYDSYSALSALIEAGVQVDELQRGIVDYYAGQYGMAMQALTRYLLNQPADAAKAYHYYALSSRAIGGYEESIQNWDKLIQNFPDHSLWDDAWEQKAYTQWAFLGQYDAAIETLKTFAINQPSHPRAAEFLFDAALVEEMAGYLDQAAETFEQVYNLYPISDYSPRCLFLAGISQYRLQDYSAALVTFTRFANVASTLEDKASAYFWLGKTQQALGDNQSAQSTWEFTSNIDPTGYYSERAKDILNQRQPFEAPPDYDLSYDIQTEKQRAEHWLRQTFGLPETTDLSGVGDLISHPNFQRGVVLWDLGMVAEANAEFDQARLAYQQDAAHLYRLANYLFDIGSYRLAILATRQILNLAGMDDATSLNAPAYFNHRRFANFYEELILSLANEFGFHPLFIFSIVRQESLFDSAIGSAAGARGLMQIMPSTAEEIVKLSGWPANFSTEDLYRPMVNLRLGISYLARQRDSFDGNLYAALAAYNGGPTNARTWLNSAPGDIDLFLEVIRYKETRDYVRRVYEIYNLYRLIYQKIGP